MNKYELAVKNANKKRKRFFVDMDGTLAVWKAAATMEELYAPGYFLNVGPQMSVVKAVRQLAADPRNEVFILSAVFADCPTAVVDKNSWLDKYLPCIDRAHRVFASVSTPKHIAVPGGVQPGDTLLDDYTKNLLEWSTQKGAVGVKLLNGINHTRKTWKGAKIHMDQGADAIVAAVTNAAKGEAA